MLVKRKHLVVVASLAVSCWFAPFTAAVPSLANTDIKTLVCTNDAAPRLMIDSPQSDSTVSVLRVPIHGTVLHVSQIIITVDGEYDQTVSLASGAERYETIVTVGTGTRTIQLEAIGICGQSITSNIILTVAPTAAVPAIIETVSPPEFDTFSKVSGTEDRAVMPFDRVVMAADVFVATLTQLVAPILFLASASLAVYVYLFHQFAAHQILLSRHGRMLLITFGVLGMCVALFLNR